MMTVLHRAMVVVLLVVGLSGCVGKTVYLVPMQQPMRNFDEMRRNRLNVAELP